MSTFFYAAAAVLAVLLLAGLLATAHLFAEPIIVYALVAMAAPAVAVLAIIAVGRFLNPVD